MIMMIVKMMDIIKPRPFYKHKIQKSFLFPSIGRVSNIKHNTCDQRAHVLNSFWDRNWHHMSLNADLLMLKFQSLSQSL